MTRQLNGRRFFFFGLTWLFPPSCQRLYRPLRVKILIRLIAECNRGQSAFRYSLDDVRISSFFVIPFRECIGTTRDACEYPCCISSYCESTVPHDIRGVQKSLTKNHSRILRFVCHSLIVNKKKASVALKL